MAPVPPGAFDTPPPPTSNNGVEPDSLASGDLGNLAPNTVASRLNAKSGRDVAIAAAAHLQICLGRGTFTQAELLANMKAQTGYYKTAMNNHMTEIIKGLVASNRINSLAGDQMSLAASETTSLKAKLAQS